MAAQVEFDYYIPPDVQVQSNGTIQTSDWPKVYRFNSGTEKFLLSFTGMGMPPINYLSQRGPYQHGDTLLDYRLQRRIIQYVHRRSAVECSRDGYWDIRADILNWLRPNRQNLNDFSPGRLRKRLPDGSLRDIEALIERGPVFGARSLTGWDEWGFTETLRFIAPDPTFFDPVQESVAWTLDVFNGLIFYESPLWVDHLIFPIVFGGDVVAGIQTITYTGTWLSFPTITFTGPLNQPRIDNLSTGEKIVIQYNVPAGQTLIVRLEYGNKTVTSAGANLIGTVTKDSDLATFHIAPDPEVVGGVNVLSASGAGGVVEVTQIEATWFTRYIGI